MSEEREVEEEDEVIFRTAGVVVVFRTAGVVVIFAGVKEGEAHVALFEGTAGTREEGALVLDVDGRVAKTAAPLLAD
jgi:hypothetical protein